MRKIYKRIIAIVTVMLLLLTNTLSVFANVNTDNNSSELPSPDIVSYADGMAPRALYVNMDPTSLTYIKYTDGNSLRFPIMRTNDGKYAYCIQHNVNPPSNALYTYAGQLSNQIAVLLQNGINQIGSYGGSSYMLGNESYDYYITQAGVKIYLGSAGGGVSDQYMSYSTGSASILPNARNLANLARSSSADEPSITASISTSDSNFSLQGDYFQTGVFNVTASGSYSSYTVSLNGASGNMEVINANTGDNVTGQIIPAGTPFYLKIHQSQAYDMNIGINVTLNYSVKVANKYVNGTYQDIVILEDKPKTATVTASSTLQAFGYLKLQKSSSDTTLTDNNTCYSLANAQYGVYTDSGCTNQVGTLITDANGNSNTIRLNNGTYYVKETVAPQGYALDSTVHTVNVSSANTETFPALLQVSDIPLMDPVGVLLRKVDSITQQGVASSETATLEGAEFTFKFYKNQYDVDPATQGQTPLRTWVFKTDDRGIVRFAEDYKVTGDNFWYDLTGLPSLPLGTLTIQETKSPQGYLLNDEVFIVKITEDFTSGNVFPYVEPEIPEQIYELNLVKKQYNKDVVIPNAVFEHTRPDGVVDEYITDENGSLSIKGLQYGVHTIKEKTAPNGYLLNPAEIQFRVNEDNSIEILSNTSTDETGLITLEQQEDGNLSMVVEDKVIPPTIKIIKENNKGQLLANAEFTLYADAECTQVIETAVSNSLGEINFKNIEIDRDYWVMETKAPTGYKLPIDEQGNFIKYKIRFESIPAQNVFNFIVNDTVYNNTTNDSSYYVENNAGVMRVVNTINTLLPSTGSSLNLILVVMGTMMMLSVTAFYFVKKSKGENK